MRVKKVGVIGAGVIGTGVAQDLAQTGHDVVLIDITNEILKRARDLLVRSVRMHHLVSAGAQRQNVNEIVDRVHFSRDYELLGNVDFVIENVTEDLDAKKTVYEQLDRVCSPECILATNTSAIPVARLASFTSRVSRVLGMHFMNPVPLKPVVEVIRGAHTSNDTIETAKILLQQMNKEGIVVNDSPGFVSNRVLMLTINEAANVLQDEVATAKAIDSIFKGCFGHKMGPLETADLIGLDTIVRTLEVLHLAFDDDKFKPCPMLKKLVDNGCLGRKTARGFHDYASG